jgi:DNA-binding NarL/FixJ family response regulator
MARVLIVDDSIVMRKNLVSILSEAGHEIVGQAVNGKQAITMYEELKPDLVTMDISMPIMRGVDAVKEIVEADKEAKIIIVSALNQKQMVFEALNNGAKHYIIKPIDPSKVIGIVNEVLGEEGAVETEPNLMEKEPEKEIESKEPGFKVQNIDGSFVVTFNKGIGIKDIIALEMAVIGLTFIKPLSIIFDFGNIEEVPEEVLRSVQRLMKKVKDAEGKYEIKAESKKIQYRLG